MSTPITKPKFAEQTQVAGDERVSALITSMVVLVGTIVTLFFLFWLLSMMGNRPTEAIAIAALGEVGEDRPKGEADDPEEPGVEEFPEVEVPQLADALEAVTDAVSSIQGRLERVDGSAQQMGRGTGLGDREGGGGNGTGIRPWDRWNIEYANSDLRAYANQLTFFGIEIGVVSASTPRIDVISNLNRNPLARVTTKREEKRVYFTHVSPKLRRWDAQLAEQAGVGNLNGRFVVQLYPPEVTTILATLEAQYAADQGLNLSEIKSTQFMVRDAGNGQLEYYIESME